MLRYRLCNEKDCTVWIKMNRDFMKEEINDNEFWNEADRISDGEFRKVFLAGLNSPEQVRFIMFEEDEEPVGFANLMTAFSVWSHGKTMIVDDFYFKAGMRGRGYGRRGMEMIEEYAKAEGCKRLQLLAALTNENAMDFYKAIGYQSTDMKFYVKYLED